MRYGRAVVGRGEERGGALVRCVERRGLDGLGRLTRVRRFEWSLSSILRRHVWSYARQSRAVRVYSRTCAGEGASAQSQIYTTAVRRLVPKGAVFDPTGSRGRGEGWGEGWAPLGRRRQAPRRPLADEGRRPGAPRQTTAGAPSLVGRRREGTPSARVAQPSPRPRGLAPSGSSAGPRCAHARLPSSRRFAAARGKRRPKGSAEVGLR